jgi:uncharacterized protein DUF4395
MGIDPRGPRFGALITTAVFVAILIAGGIRPAVAVWLLVFQAAVFAVATFLGIRYAPYGLAFRYLIRPRLAPPKELEAPAPPRFAQGVGLVVALIAIVGYATSLHWLGVLAAAGGLVAAFLNGVFGLCLGCELYLIIRRVLPASQVSGAGRG